MQRATFVVLFTSVWLSANCAQAQAPLNACDLTSPYGVVDVTDVQAAINMAIGSSSCTANLGVAGLCNAAVVQRVVNATLPGGTCNTGPGLVPHYVTLNWTASTSANITAYKVYRSGTSGGPYTLLGQVGAATIYYDNTVQAGQTYFYVTTAVDSSGAESGYSNEARATVPTP